MASGNWGWGGVRVGKGIVIFTRPLLVVNIGAACVQYILTNSTTSISGYCVRVLVNT